MNVKKILWITTALICFATVATSSALGCYTVVVGKEASADGSVLVGHDEQYGPRIMNFRIIESSPYHVFSVFAS